MVRPHSNVRFGDQEMSLTGRERPVLSRIQRGTYQTLGLAIHFKFQYDTYMSRYFLQHIEKIMRQLISVFKGKIMVNSYRLHHLKDYWQAICVFIALSTTCGGLLSGCETPRISPASLAKASSQQTITLTKEYEYHKKLSFGAEESYALIPGEYQADLVGKEGTFFRGPTNAVVLTILDGNIKLVQSYDGGVFIPFAEAKSAKIYQYVVAKGRGRYFDRSTGLEQLPATSSGQATTELADVATNLVVPPNATPSQTLVGGVSAGIGAAIVQAMISADEGKFIYPESQPTDRSLRDAFGL